MTCIICAEKLSAQNLEAEVKARYVSKTLEAFCVDPYVSRECSVCPWKVYRSRMPEVTYTDTYNYFVTSKSAYTHQQFRAYKALEAYSVCLWMGEIREMFAVLAIHHLHL